MAKELSDEFIKVVVIPQVKNIIELRSRINLSNSELDLEKVYITLKNYISSIKALLISIPKQLFGEDYIRLYRRIEGLELSVLKINDSNQIIRALNAADEAIVDLMERIYNMNLLL
ncbi:MAG: hypothetical protein ACP5I6_04795 [Caldisphaera sp.]|nr:MAG: hypothetical protein C0201_04460 [Caldisphaera sp.]